MSRSGRCCRVHHRCCCWSKAAAIAHFIDYAASTGQTPGLSSGQLPPGFLPLTPALRAQARKAAQEILNQSGGTTP